MVISLVAYTSCLTPGVSSVDGAISLFTAQAPDKFSGKCKRMKVKDLTGHFHTVRL